MNLDQLKKGFFGYKKTSVYEYISSLEEEFSNKLLEKDSLNQKKEEEQLSKIQKLESELKETKQQLDTLRSEQMMIGSTLMEAKRYAERLKIEAEEEKEKAHQQLEHDLAQSREELEHYHAQINTLKEAFANLLHDMDKNVKKLDIQVQTLKEESPRRNMTLFERKIQA